MASDSRYLPSDTPAIKRVAAAEGGFVCASGDMIYIKGNRFDAVNVLP